MLGCTFYVKSILHFFFLSNPILYWKRKSPSGYYQRKSQENPQPWIWNCMLRAKSENALLEEDPDPLILLIIEHQARCPTPFHLFIFLLHTRSQTSSPMGCSFGTITQRSKSSLVRLGIIQRILWIVANIQYF